LVVNCVSFTNLLTAIFLSCEWIFIETFLLYPQKLKESLDNVIEHYCNNHANCHNTSRCKRDSNYEPSRIVITNGKVKNMLAHSQVWTKLILFIPKTNSLILKNIHNIVKAFHIECVFAQNIILGMLVNCRFTDAPATQKGKKVYKQLTYNYRQNIWNRYISTFYWQ
jgi:hypothetical protein